MFQVFLTIAVLFLQLQISVSTVQASDRPPQFVMLAFDNCQENQTWKDVSKFLDEMNSIQPDRLRFTFFLSAVGLLADQKKQIYTDPMGRTGKSNINFGGNDLSVLERVSWINKLHSEGNEIASHAVGHFSGKSWSVQQWRHEFKQYSYIVDNIVQIHGWTGAQAKKGTLLFKAKDLKGFRAPYLEGGTAVNQVLTENGFIYDTSDTNQGFDPTTWPKKFSAHQSSEGLWNFGLGFIKLPLTVASKNSSGGPNIRTKTTTTVAAMDYNFCFRQTGDCPVKDPYAAEADKDASEVLQGYLNYFLKNYNGNRAPVHIGHHFFQYRGGAYNRILLKFARAVCSQPEVRCTTYEKLAEFMNESGTAKRNEFQAAKFPKAQPLSIEDLNKLIK